MIDLSKNGPYGTGKSRPAHLAVVDGSGRPDKIPPWGQQPTKLDFKAIFDSQVKPELPQAAVDYMEHRGLEAIVPWLLANRLVGWYAKENAITFALFHPKTSEIVGIQKIPVDGSKKKFWKGSNAKEGIFVIKGKPGAPENIVEAVMDGLSYRIVDDDYTVVIVFSASTVKKLKLLNLENPVLFFDNDPAGRKATQKAAAILTNAKTVDWSLAPSEKKDINELLVNDHFEVISKMVETAKPLPNKTVQPQIAKLDHDNSRYGEKALSEELSKICCAIQGERNQVLNQSAFKLGQLVGGGVLERGQIEAALMGAAASIGLDQSEADTTIDSGLSAGVSTPRTAPEQEGRSILPASGELTTSAESEQTKPTLDILSDLCVTKEYADMLGEEQWYFQYLIIKNQIVVIIAKSGGGKTTILFEFVVPWMITNHGIEVFYLDCDSPASDHKRMLKRAKKIGPKFHWINPVTHGKGPEVLLDLLKSLVDQGQRLDDKLFILDTLKKFVDIMNKRDVKPFFKLLRQLTALGATIVLLGHANKHRGDDGNLIFEGVGDILSDTDALIVFERMPAIDGIDVTTVVDPDKGAKVRGIYKPISFHIDEQRRVTQYDQIIDVPDWSAGAKSGKLTDDEIESEIRNFLKGKTGHIKQKDVLAALKDKSGIGYNRLYKVLTAVSIHEKEETRPGQIYFSVGQNNAKSYSVAD